MPNQHSTNISCGYLKKLWISHNERKDADNSFILMESLNLPPDSKVHGANMGPTWVLSAPDGPHEPCYHAGPLCWREVPHMHSTRKKFVKMTVLFLQKTMKPANVAALRCQYTTEWTTFSVYIFDENDTTFNIEFHFDWYIPKGASYKFPHK